MCARLPPKPNQLDKAAGGGGARGRAVAGVAWVGTSDAGTPAAAAKRSASRAKGGKGEAAVLLKGKPAATVFGASTTVSAAERAAESAVASSSCGRGITRERARQAGTRMPERIIVCVGKGTCQKRAPLGSLSNRKRKDRASAAARAMASEWPVLRATA